MLAWVGAGSMQSALLRATRGSQEMCGGATTSQRRVRRLGPAPWHRGARSHRQRRGQRGRLVLAEAAPTHLCTHANAFVAKSPIKASDDTWKGLPVNRLRTVRIGVGAAQGGRGERPSRAEGVRARARRACVRVRARAQSVHDMRAARLRSLVRRPFADLRRSAASLNGVRGRKIGMRLCWLCNAKLAQDRFAGRPQPAPTVPHEVLSSSPSGLWGERSLLYVRL